MGSSTDQDEWKEIAREAAAATRKERRGSTKESRDANDGFLLFVIAAAAASGAAGVGFVATGGKISPEHRSALRRIGR